MSSFQGNKVPRWIVQEPRGYQCAKYYAHSSTQVFAGLALESKRGLKIGVSCLYKVEGGEYRVEIGAANGVRLTSGHMDQGTNKVYLYSLSRSSQPI